jgi:transposase-like protein
LLDRRIRVWACYEAASPALGTVLRDDFVRDLPAAVRCFLHDFEACTAHLGFPLRHRKVIRTTNLLERLFGEERRRTKVMSHAFGERPVLKLMYAAVIRAADPDGARRQTNLECLSHGGVDRWNESHVRGVTGERPPRSARLQWSLCP